MLADERLVGFITTSKPAEARAFFEGTLGLPFLVELDHALVFRAGAGQIMVVKTDTVTPPFGTALGWIVADLPAAVRTLAAKGVAFERFEGMDQDELGVWRPGGPATGVAWFKDPDGNLLSLSLG